MCTTDEKAENRTKIERLIQAVEALTAMIASQYAPRDPAPSTAAPAEGC